MILVLKLKGIMDLSLKLLPCSGLLRNPTNLEIR